MLTACVLLVRSDEKENALTEAVGHTGRVQASFVCIATSRPHRFPVPEPETEPFLLVLSGYSYGPCLWSNEPDSRCRRPMHTSSFTDFLAHGRTLQKGKNKQAVIIAITVVVPCVAV